jgi:ATP-binding cassette subfamily B protein
MFSRSNLARLSKTFVKQYSQFYCGLACLATVVKYYGGETTQEKLREISGTTLNGTSLLGLYQAAKKLKFEVGAYEADLKNLAEIAKPVILHIVKDQKLEHFVVCYGFENGKFIIGDPASGIEYYSENELETAWKSKALLQLAPGKDFVTKKNESQNKRVWFLELIKDDYPILGIAAFLGVVISALGLATAIFSQKLIDHLLPEKNIDKLIFGIILFGFILVARAGIGYVRSLFLVRQSKDMNTRLVNGFFSKLLFLPKSFFDSTSIGDMVARLNDASRIQKVVVYLSSQIIIDVLVVLVSSGYIFAYSVSTGVFSLLSIPVFGLLAWRFNHRVIVAQRQVMQSYAANEGKYIDTINGVNAIKSFNRENLFSKTVNTIYGFFMQKVFDLGMIGAKLNLWISASSGLLLTGIISWTAYLVLNEQILLGQMMAIITLVGSMGASVLNISMSGIQFQEARIAFDRMYEFAATEPEYRFESTANKVLPDIHRIELKNLNFRFPGKSLLLGNINMSFNKGTITTIFGEIGCGKSTLISVLQRFYPFESGQILINSEDWMKIETANWREQIAVVPQHIKLFNGTIFENICLEENPNFKKVSEFCQSSGFETFINEFQQGYFTIVNENSTNLSGGQQQLVALARALYHKPKVLLMDEATAAMDRRTENFVVGLLQKIKHETIIIFVTHRVQLARQTDYIYVIENKQLAASGTHDTLVGQNRLYREAFEDILLHRL